LNSAEQAGRNIRLERLARRFEASADPRSRGRKVGSRSHKVVEVGASV